MTGAPRPLQGRRVLLTRPADQAVEWAEALAAEGAAVECVPTIRILPTASAAPLRAACRELAGYEWVAFTSANGVRAVLQALGAEGVAWPPGTNVAVVGAATAAAARAGGLRVDLSAKVNSAAGLAAELAERAAGPVLHPSSDRSEGRLAELLAARGIACRCVEAYRTVPGLPADLVEAVWRRLDAGEFAAIAFASPSSVEGLCLGRDEPLGRAGAGEESGAKVPAATRIVCIGERTAAAARARGFQVAAVAASPDAAGLVAALRAALGVDGAAR